MLSRTVGVLQKILKCIPGLAVNSYVGMRHALPKSMTVSSIQKAYFSSYMYPNNTALVSHTDCHRHNGSLLNFGSSFERPILSSITSQSLIQVRGFKIVLRPRLICDGCYFAWHHGRKHVECSDHPRHKQIKKLSDRKVWKEDYSKGKFVMAMDWNRRIHRQFDRNVDRTVLSHNWLAGKLGTEL